jgi:predicted Mrr-cat superfamily restriction endonuclease
MPRYWVIAPAESKPLDIFDKVWQYDLANDFISIGWTELGDVSKMDREDISKAVTATYQDKPPQTKSLYTNMIWAFYHEINPGDFVIARRGRKTIAAVGKVVESTFYGPGTNPTYVHSNFLKVSWQEQPRDKLFSSIVFPMHTLAEITEEQFRNLLEGTSLQTSTLDVSEAIEDPNTFVLEKYLEEFIVSNFDMIFKGDLKIYEDEDGNDGQQYATEIGSIDILAIEPNSNSFVVIELKKGRPSDQVIGQILRYMGWIQKNLSSNKRPVKGLVICHEPDPKLSYALEMIDNVDVLYYSVSFKLKEIP